MSLILIILVSLAIGWLFSKMVDGKWVAVKDPSPSSDASHFWIRIRRTQYAFTAEQLTVARERATRLKAK